MSKKQDQGTNLLYRLIGEARTYDDVIVMGRGDPDFDTPAHIVAAAKQAMIHHHADHAPPEGLPALREAIAQRVKRVNNIDVDPATEVVVTNGGQEALFLMVLAVIKPGDEMIVPEPNYNTYADSLAFRRRRQSRSADLARRCLPRRPSRRPRRHQRTLPGALARFAQ